LLYCSRIYIKVARREASKVKAPVVKKDQEVASVVVVECKT